MKKGYSGLLITSFSTLLIACCLSAHAISKGPYSPGAYSSVTLPGSTCGYINQGNVNASDNLYASAEVNLAADGYFTDYLVVTDFKFDVPAGALITGIIVEIERNDGVVKAKDNAVRIVKGGIIGSVDRSKNAGWSSTDAITAYGTINDKWGLTWTYSDINASDFGFAISAKRKGNGTHVCFALIDHIQITVHYTTVLPIELLTFNALCTNENIVQLNWQTQTEMNNDYFSVERSTDGINFTEIGQVDGAGNSSVILEYTYNDQNPVAGSINYYRLKQTDTDGSFSYSSVQAITTSIQAPLTLSIYPNPSHGQFSLLLPEGSVQDFNIRIFNVINEDVSSQFKIHASSSNTITIESSEGIFKQGVYFLEMKDQQGSIRSGKILID